MKKRKENKYIIIIGLILILISALFSFKFIYEHYKDKQETEKIINELFPIIDQEEVTDVEVIQEEQVKQKKEFTLSSNYLGYIELSRFGIKRLITTGTDKNTLDKGLVGTMKMSAMLDDEYGNIIIAGHSTSNVFQRLHNTKINDEIKIVSHFKKYTYVVTEIHTIKDDDMSYFKYETNRKILTLVTCKNNSKQRLIVIAELRG